MIVNTISDSIICVLLSSSIVTIHNINSVGVPPVTHPNPPHLHPDQDGNTALSWANERGHEDIVQLLTKGIGMLLVCDVKYVIVSRFSLCLT